MNENEKVITRKIACSMFGGYVPVNVYCVGCPYWKEEKCTRLGRKKLKLPRGRQRPKKLRLKGGGKGLKVPPVREKWPHSGLEEGPQGAFPKEEDGPSYGVAGFMDDIDEGTPEPWETESADFGEDVLLEEPDLSVEPDIIVGEKEPDILEPTFPDSMDSPVSPVPPVGEPVTTLSESSPATDPLSDPKPGSPSVEGVPDDPLGKIK